MLSTKKVLKIIEILEDCHSNEIPLSVKLDSLGKVLDMQCIADIELKHLCYSAAIRWLYRSNQKHLAWLVLHEKQKISGGNQSSQVDPHGTIIDINEKLDIIESMQSKRGSLVTNDDLAE